MVPLSVGHVNKKEYSHFLCLHFSCYEIEIIYLCQDFPSFINISCSDQMSNWPSFDSRRGLFPVATRRQINLPFRSSCSTSQNHYAISPRSHETLLIRLAVLMSFLLTFKKPPNLTSCANRGFRRDRAQKVKFHPCQNWRCQKRNLFDSNLY